MAGISLICYGVRIGIRVNTECLLPGIVDHLPPGWRLSDSPVVGALYSVAAVDQKAGTTVRDYRIYAGSTCIARTMYLDDLFEALATDLQLYVAEHSPRYLFIRAGVVAWQGRAIVIPGFSNTSTRTLMAEWVRRGATIVSGEFAVIDSAGSTQLHANPHSIRELAHRGNVPVESPNREPGVTPMPVGFVVFAKYRPGARWRPRSLSPGRGILALLSHTVAARRRPQLVLARLLALVRNAKVSKGCWCEAGEVVESFRILEPPKGN